MSHEEMDHESGASAAVRIVWLVITACLMGILVTVGRRISVHPISVIVIVVVFLLILGYIAKMWGAFTKGGGVIFLVLALLGLIPLWWFCEDRIPAILGMRHSQHMTSEAVTLPNTTWVAEATFEIRPYRVNKFSLELPRGDVLPLLLEDGTLVRVKRNWGYINSNLGLAMADTSLDGLVKYRHSCRFDSALYMPAQREISTWFVSTRYACDTCQVGRGVLSFETPGGPPCKGEEIKTGKIFTVHGESVAVGRVNAWYDGSPDGHYIVTLQFSKKPRPYNVVATTALLPKPGTMLTTSSPFRIRVFLLYCEYKDNLVAVDGINFASIAIKGNIE